MYRISLIVGARPNFMKAKPILDALEDRGAKVSLVHTGQHYDPLMSDIFFEDLGLRHPDHHLGVGSGSQAEQTARILVAYEELLLTNGVVDAVVVVGDVNSTMACALVGAKLGAVVAHVEAGLRSRDWAMPEEINRVVADKVSDLLLAPSPDAVVNLRAEGFREDQIHLVGNVMIDSLFANIGRAKKRNAAASFGLSAGKYGLVTLHRPATVDNPDILIPLVQVLDEIAADLPLLFAAHPRTRAMLDRLGIGSQVRLVPPQGYLDFLSLQAGAAAVLTDSGGVQEETTGLGVPCLTLRDNTERPITIEEGTNKLVGTDPEAVHREFRHLMAFGMKPRRPALWDGKAGGRVATAILDRLRMGETAPRPTSMHQILGEFGRGTS